MHLGLNSVADAKFVADSLALAAAEEGGSIPGDGPPSEFVGYLQRLQYTRHLAVLDIDVVDLGRNEATAAFAAANASAVVGVVPVVPWLYKDSILAVNKDFPHKARMRDGDCFYV